MTAPAHQLKIQSQATRQGKTKNSKSQQISSSNALFPLPYRITVDYEYSALRAMLPFNRREMGLLLTEMNNKLTSLHPEAPTCLECLICSDAYMENLNRKFLHTPGPTNTLAFENSSAYEYAADASCLPSHLFTEEKITSEPLKWLKTTTPPLSAKAQTAAPVFPEPAEVGMLPSPYLFPFQRYGQIYFCAPQYARELLLYAQPKDEYVIFLLAHALTHLAGLEHGREMDLISSQLYLAGMQCVHSL